MILKPSLSFAGPREYRWQGLEVPVMMGKQQQQHLAPSRVAPRQERGRTRQ
jgi:hypothetical protein